MFSNPDGQTLSLVTFGWLRFLLEKCGRHQCRFTVGCGALSKIRHAREEIVIAPASTDSRQMVLQVAARALVVVVVKAEAEIEAQVEVEMEVVVSR